MKPRFVVLLVLLSGVVIATVWRIATPRPRAQPHLQAVDARPAPLFQLLDQHDRPIQLNGYLNRYRILLIFFDAESGPSANPLLRKAKEFYPALTRAGVKVFAVSSPLSPENKQMAQQFPFPILRDTLAGRPESCCTIWGRTISTTEMGAPEQVQPAAFLIAADGTVAWDGDAPQPVDDIESLIVELISGR